MLGTVLLGACGGDDEGGGSGGSGTGGSGGATGGSGGSAGGSGGATGGTAGTGGAAGATGGTAGATGGTGGATGGSGGATGGTGGATGGTGGATGGSGGATGGTGGSTGGTGGSTGGTGGTGGSTGGTGGSTGGTGGTGGSSTCGPTCGNAPYQCFDPIGTVSAAGAPLTAVTVNANICPTVTIQVPYQGTSAMQIERNAPYFLIGKQTGALTAFSIEGKVTVSVFPKLAAMLSMFPPTYPATVNPAYSASSMATINVLINSTKGGATAPCVDKAGVTFAVTGHPEAVIKYPNNGTATGSGGDAKASITIVTTGTESAPEYVYVTATKASCVLGLNAADKLFLTGRTPVAINAVTSGVGFEISN